MKVKGYNPEGQDPNEAAKTFFNEVMQIADFNVKRAYWQGHWLICELYAAGDKSQIFTNLKKLKNKKPPVGKRFQVEEYLPEPLKEKKQRERQITYLNKKLPDGQRADVKFEKGEVYINKVKHTRQIPELKARELLQLDSDDFKRLENVHVCQTGKETAKGSVFTAFAAEVMSIDQVVDIYTHLKIKYQDASHIAAAYRLPGENVADLQDYYDDREYGCGRTLLNALVDGEKFFRAIFLVRQYGHQQLGKARFDIFKRLAEQAIEEIAKDCNLAKTSSLGYQMQLLPRGYQSSSEIFRGNSLTRRRLRKSQWSIPEAVDDEETSVFQTDDEVDSEVAFNTQQFQERLDRLRHQPCEDWSSEFTGEWEKDKEANTNP